MAGVTREEVDWGSEPTAFATVVRLRWWFARFLGSLADGRRAVMAATFLAPITFLAIFLVVLAVA